jgi:tetratricopeptide (TPR) repeat protein
MGAAHSSTRGGWPADNPAGPLAAIVLAAASWLVAVPPKASALDPSVGPAATPGEIDALVAQLGDSDYAVRESASGRLAALGAQATDALLTAAETSTNLEVALRARWLAESLPLAVAGDAPEAVALLERFNSRGFDERVQVMHRLLRLDDGAGIEPLARIVRLERTAAGSRIAAALLAREWQPDDPSWPGIAPRIIAGVGGSRRPAARFLSAMADFSMAAGREQAAALDAAVEAIGKADAGGDEPSGLPRAEQLGIARTGRIFRRCLVQMLAVGGRREAALAEAKSLLASAGDEADPDEQMAADLEWLATHGLPEAVDLVGRLTDPDVSPVLTYAAAVAWRLRDDEAAAERVTALSAMAAQRLEENGSLGERFQAAMLLAHWGEEDWALEQYRAAREAPGAGLAQRALAATYAAELLHDRMRDAEAAATLREVLDGPEDEVAEALMRIDRDPRATRSRMLFFEACAADTPAARRRLLEESLRHYPKEVDTLIALYSLADNTPMQKADAAARVARAIEQIEEEIRALPDDANAKNEYAWLVANTEGDVAKAVGYSRQSLEDAFDNASYLDTLAHCHAAAGNLERAVRVQSLAVRHEPNSVLVRRNLERFQERFQERFEARLEGAAP